MFDKNKFGGIIIFRDNKIHLKTVYGLFNKDVGLVFQVSLPVLLQ